MKNYIFTIMIVSFAVCMEPLAATEATPDHVSVLNDDTVSVIIDQWKKSTTALGGIAKTKIYEHPALGVCLLACSGDKVIAQCGKDTVMVDHTGASIIIRNKACLGASYDGTYLIMRDRHGISWWDARCNKEVKGFPYSDDIASASAITSERNYIIADDGSDDQLILKVTPDSNDPVQLVAWQKKGEVLSFDFLDDMVLQGASVLVPRYSVLQGDSMLVLRYVDNDQIKHEVYPFIYESIALSSTGNELLGVRDNDTIELRNLVQEDEGYAFKPNRRFIISGQPNKLRVYIPKAGRWKDCKMVCATYDDHQTLTIFEPDMKRVKLNATFKEPIVEWSDSALLSTTKTSVSLVDLHELEQLQNITPAQMLYLEQARQVREDSALLDRQTIIKKLMYLKGSRTRASFSPVCLRNVDQFIQDQVVSLMTQKTNVKSECCVS